MAKSSAADNQEKLINLQAQQLAAQVANWAAQLEFQKERMRLLELPEMQGKLQVDIDRLAWEKAQDEWERAIKEATLTGTYNGQPTIEWMTQQAQLTGVLNGQQTLQGKLTDAQIRQMQQQMDLANAQFLTSATGYLNGQKTFDREKFEATQATDAWKFLATLTGPANAFKQARAISTMPGGLEGIMGAWAGQYSPAGFGAVGSGGRASLEGLIGGGGPGTPYYYPPAGNFQQPPGPYYQPPGFYPSPGGGAPPAGPPGGGSPLEPINNPYQPIGGGGAPVGTPSPAPGQTPAPATGPQGQQGQLDSGFYVWLKVHGYDPGNPAMRDRLAEFINNYTGLPSYDHTQYLIAAAADPGSYQFDLSNWLNPSSFGYSGSLPGLPTMTRTPPSGPTDDPNAPPPLLSLPPAPTGVIPGRGFTPNQWNAATQQAVAAWNAAHPGYIADGSQQGYHIAPGYSTTPTPPETIGGLSSVANEAGGAFPTTKDPNAPGNTVPNFTTEGATARPWYLDPRQYAEYDALPQATKDQYMAQSQVRSGFGYGAQNPYSYQPAGVQAPQNQWNYSVNPSGSVSSYPPGVSSPYSTPDISSPYAMSPQTASNLYQFGGGQQQQQQYSPGTGGTTATATSNPLLTNPWTGTQNGLPLPNQINARNYANSYAYQKELGWAGYEDAGWDKALAQEAFERSLPKATGPKRGSFAF